MAASNTHAEAQARYRAGDLLAAKALFESALADDPHQWRNLWHDPAAAGVKADLLADMRDNVPEGRADPLERVALVATSELMATLEEPACLD